MTSFSRDCLIKLLLAAVTTALTAGTSGQVPNKSQTATMEIVTLQYRVARDAYAPSRFVALSDSGMSPPLELIWDLRIPDSKQEQEALEKQKIEFDRLIESLEEKEINGVKFICEGEWTREEARLRITTIPEPTEARGIEQN